MSKKFGRLLLKLITIVIFVITGFFALFFANGYKYDLKNSNVRKTSIIDLVANLKDINVMLDGNFVSRILPFQIKDLLPGHYNLSIKKNNFLDWNRKVEVREDFVTIVNDILMVPTKLDGFIKLIVTFTLDYRYFPGQDYLVLLKPGESTLRLLSFYHDGTFKDEDLDLYRKGIVDVQILSKDSLLLKFDDGVFAWISLSDRNFKFFSLPLGIERVKISHDDQILYYLKDHKLYRIPLYVLALKKPENINASIITEGVDQYALSLSSKIYFLSSGRLFSIDDNGKNLKLLGKDVDNYENLNIKNGNTFATLVLRGIDGKRHLYMVNSTEQVKLLQDDLNGQPFLNDKDQLIYADNSGNIYYYDPILAKRTLIEHVTLGFEILGWFSNEGHFLIKKDNQLFLDDIFNANVHVLLNDDSKITTLFILQKALFYLQDNKIYSLYWPLA